MAKEISPPINFVRDQNVNCTNSISSYTCTCRNGFYSDVNVLMDTVVMVIIVSIIPTDAAKKVQRFLYEAGKGS